MAEVGLKARRLLLTALAAAILTLAIDGASASADALPGADLVLVSMTANVTHAKVGGHVTFTIVARNDGPDPVDINVVENPWQLYGDVYPRADFTLGEEICSNGVSADTPACEWGEAQPGATFTTSADMIVNESAPRMASNTACVFSWNGPISDSNPANDCVTTKVKVVGPRQHGQRGR